MTRNFILLQRLAQVGLKYNSRDPVVNVETFEKSLTSNELMQLWSFLNELQFRLKVQGHYCVGKAGSSNNPRQAFESLELSWVFKKIFFKSSKINTKQ